MSNNRRMKSQGGRRNKSKSHKGVKKGGTKKNYRKGGLKSRKRGEEGSLGLPPPSSKLTMLVRVPDLKGYTSLSLLQQLKVQASQSNLAS
ncbi:spermatid nuclear transition protein 1 isoform X1 [Macrotis lagotis]|uniref:spermatid nuclear transition protein 1 isoform X1 n=1 Tax=Macrotis lagotis TaxID=92651 RepID=UPI003D687D05